MKNSFFRKMIYAWLSKKKKKRITVLVFTETPLE